MAKTQSERKKLKPEIEKKRRDRINHNLSVLRTLLFNSTSDTRLQNPKVEKAEILDLAVQYIQKHACDKTDEKASVNQTITDVTHTVSAAYQRLSAFSSLVGQMDHFEKLNSRVNLEYYLDCHPGHSPKAERDTKSTHCLSTSMYPTHKQDSIFMESASTDSKSACQKPIVFTQSEMLSHTISPFYLPVTSPVPQSLSSSPLYSTEFSVCSPGSLPQLLHNPITLQTSLPLNLDTRETFHLSQTWRPWS